RAGGVRRRGDRPRRRRLQRLPAVGAARAHPRDLPVVHRERCDRRRRCCAVRGAHADGPGPPMTRRGAVLFAAMCVIWGIPYLMIRVAVRELSPVTLVVGRTLIATALLLPLAAYRHELRLERRHWPPLLAFTAIEISLPWLPLATAETRLTS